MAITKVTNSVVGSGSATDGYVLTADGSGNSAWEEVAGGPTFKTFGTSSIMIGDTTTGTIDAANYNVGLGIDVFAALTSGDNNIAIGFEAVDALTTGGNNVGIGYKALSASNGSWSVAVGSEALKTEATSGSNVAIGGLSMQTSNGASNNVAVGKQTGYLLTTGDYNVFVGSNCGFNQTTASNNTAMGYLALYSNTTGSDNTLIGQSAGTANTTASQSTFLGKNSGLAVTTGNQNTFLGYNAGYNLISGFANTIVGSNTHLNTNGDNYNIVMGYNCKAQRSENSFTFGSSTGSDRVYNHFNSNATWSRVSDERYKEEITDNTDCGLAFINDLRPVTFKWKPKSTIDSSLPDYDSEKTERSYDKKMYGLIAQEVKEAIDKHNITDFGGWDEEESSGIQAISQGMFVHPLIKAVQELSTQVDELKSELLALKGK